MIRRAKIEPCDTHKTETQGPVLSDAEVSDVFPTPYLSVRGLIRGRS